MAEESQGYEGTGHEAHLAVDAPAAKANLDASVTASAEAASGIESDDTSATALAGDALGRLLGCQDDTPSADTSLRSFEADLSIGSHDQSISGIEVPGSGGTVVDFRLRAIKMNRQGLDQRLNLTASAVARDVNRGIQESRRDYSALSRQGIQKAPHQIDVRIRNTDRRQPQPNPLAPNVDRNRHRTQILQSTITRVEKQLARITATAQPAQLKK